MEGFEILEKLGEGAYSIVYKVKRKEDSNIYALKKVKLKGLSDKGFKILNIGQRELRCGDKSANTVQERCNSGLYGFGDLDGLDPFLGPGSLKLVPCKDVVGLLE